MLTPGQLTPDEVGLLRGANVRVVIPVSTTDGAVLAVPLAAVTSGSDGATRVEVDRHDGETEFIHVEVGLSAGGYAEIRPVHGQLNPVSQPVLLLADEPTGNLDTATAASILDLFDELHRGGLTLAVITHDEHISRRAERRVRIVDGHGAEAA